MKNTIKLMFVAFVMTLALAACGGKAEKAAADVDSLTNEVNAALDTAAKVIAPSDTLLNK
jgi:predicted small lipoprotein YifL